MISSTWKATRRFVRRRVLLLAAVVALLVLPPGLAVAFLDGAPPPQRPEPGTRVYAPVIESWSLLAAGNGTDVGGLLCSDAHPCDEARLLQGGACALTLRVWLASAVRERVVLRDVSLLLYAVAWTGTGEMREDGVWNSSVRSAQFPVPWENGWWWKPESERVAFAVPTPCDARLVTVSINVRGEDLRGREVTAAQGAEVALLPDR